MKTHNYYFFFSPPESSDSLKRWSFNVYICFGTRRMVDKQNRYNFKNEDSLLFTPYGCIKLIRKEPGGLCSQSSVSLPSESGNRFPLRLRVSWSYLVYAEMASPCVRAFFWPMDIQLLKHHLLKSFLHWIASALLSKVSWAYLCGFISGFLFSSIDHICPSLCQCHTVLVTVSTEALIG